MCKLFLCLIIVVAFFEVRGKLISKRFLIFPQANPTRHQFIAGIGIPAELELQSLTMGYVFKAQYYLPINATIFRTSPLIPEYRVKRSAAEEFYSVPVETIATGTLPDAQRDEVPSSDLSRWAVYKAIEEAITSTGLNGPQCLLHAICEAARSPFGKSLSLLAHIMDIFFKPSTTPLDIADSKHNEYILAEISGRQGGHCEDKFSDCKRPLLKTVSFLI